MTETEQGVCDRCGRNGPVRPQFMWHGPLTLVLNRGDCTEHFCPRCRKVLRIYGWIALALVLGTIVFLAMLPWLSLG